MNLRYEIITPDGIVGAGEAAMVVLAGSEGDCGIMGGHAPFMTVLRAGEVLIHSASDSTETSAPQSFALQGGFAEVDSNGLTILADC